MITVVAGLGAAATAAAFAAVRRPGSRRLGLSPSGASGPALLGIIVVSAAIAWWSAGMPPLVLLGAAVAVVAARRLRCRAQRRAAQAARDRDAVVLCFALASELRAGRSPADALAAAAGQLAAFGPAVAAAGRAVGHGAAVHEELRALAEGDGCRRLLPVAAVWAATAATGARCADVLERVGRALAQDDEAAAELEALCAGPRATAWVLCILPAFGLLLGTAIGAAPLPVLLHTRVGLALAVGAVALDGAGVAWVRRITGAALAG